MRGGAFCCGQGDWACSQQAHDVWYNKQPCRSLAKGGFLLAWHGRLIFSKLSFCFRFDKVQSLAKKVKHMHLGKRQKSILDEILKTGHVTVDDLSARFGVSPQTIRTDLRELGEAGKLVRVHGGAHAVDGKKNVEYEARRQIAAAEKIAIGKRAAQLIPNNASLFVNIGTTTEAFSDAIIGRTGLMVITNNINVASRLHANSANEIILAGGVVRPSDGGVVGEAAIDFINQFKVDYAVIGASAIDNDGSILDFDFREVRAAQAIIANARHVILVADSTKFERKAPVRIGHLSQVDTFVTDRVSNTAIRDICSEADVRLLEVGISDSD